ncbi:hypothetical protein ACFX2I_028384 [Malus domestica]
MSLNFSSIEPLNGGNYKKWRQDVEIILGLMDYDLALREDEPAPVDATSTAAQRLKFEKWEKANRMALLVIKRSIGEAVRGGLPASDKAKNFLEGIEAKFKVSEKGEIGNLMTTLTTLKFDESHTVREHILKMVEAATKLSDLKVPIDDSFVVHMALNSLPESYEQLKTSYNAQKEKWSLNDLISICVQEEARMKRGKQEVVNMVSTYKGKKHDVFSGKPSKPFNFSHSAGNNILSSKGPQGFRVDMEKVKCYFCKEYGHFKRDCPNAFEMKDMGDATFVLGIEIIRDRKRCLLGLLQKSYIEKVLKRFNMESCAKGEAPMSKGDKFNKSQCPQNDIEKQSMSNRPYASLVGSLMYAQVCTRPDLAFAVSVLGRFQANPGEYHWTAAKKVVRYLQRTKSYMLVYGRIERLEVIGHCDSDFAGCEDDRRSTSGYVFLMAGGAISWRSAKQKTLATSTMQAKYISCFEATQQAMMLKNLISEMRIVDTIAKPLVIYCDNKMLCSSLKTTRNLMQLD